MQGTWSTFADRPGAHEHRAFYDVHHPCINYIGISLRSKRFNVAHKIIHGTDKIIVLPNNRKSIHNLPGHNPFSLSDAGLSEEMIRWTKKGPPVQDNDLSCLNIWATVSRWNLSRSTIIYADFMIFWPSCSIKVAFLNVASGLSSFTRTVDTRSSR